ncbi:hypothetical protein BJX64DRAFT_272136 [Aspergillus heterothallicus]
MSRPIAEVVTLTLQPGANAEKAIRGLTSILSRREGFQSLKWGRWEQDQNKVNLIIGWDDISYHKAFEQSETDFAVAGAFLGPVLAGPPFMFHVFLDPSARVTRSWRPPLSRSRHSSQSPMITPSRARSSCKFLRRSGGVWDFYMGTSWKRSLRMRVVRKDADGLFSWVGSQSTCMWQLKTRMPCRVIIT